MPEAPGAPERRHPSTPDTSSAVGRSPRPSGSRPRPRARSGDREQLLLRAVDEVEVRPLPVALELPCTLIKEKLPLWCCVHRKWRHVNALQTFGHTPQWPQAALGHAQM